MKKTINTLLMVFAMFFMCSIAASTTFAKSLAIFGDSYSTWNNTDNKEDETYYYPYYSSSKGNNVTTVEQTWPNLVCNKLGMEITYRNAISGSRLTKVNESDEKAIITRIEKSPENIADVIILMGGLNDLWQNVETGEMKTDLLPSAYTYAPALQRAIHILKMKNLNSKIVYALIAYDKTADSYKAAAQNICNNEQITFVPISGMECVSFHPTIKGMEQIADSIAAAIQ